MYCSLISYVFMHVDFQVSCSCCNKTMEREVLAVHKDESCPQRIVACEYCEFPLPAIDLFIHQVITIDYLWFGFLFYLYVFWLNDWTTLSCCYNILIRFTRMYAGIEQNSAIYVADILGSVKEMSMRVDAMEA